jgi:ATP-dependent helicase/nuclease subunit A
MTVATGGREWTTEQREAIARRDGDLLLDAAAGSGKTSVLVERFVESVLNDGLDVSAILTITFTEKAAAEMRERIRRRLRELGAVEAARQTEGASISTIHAFCARLLRTHALRAGIDPRFTVLDGWRAQRLADLAFDQSLEGLGQDEPGGLELIAAYGPAPLRSAIQATYHVLRSQGHADPRLPPLVPPPDLESARARLQESAAAAASELGGVQSPSTRVVEALSRLEACSGLVAASEPWPGEVAALALPGGNGAALTTPVCREYGEALDAFRLACEHRWVTRAHRLLDLLLERFGQAYAEHKREASGLDFEDLELMALALVRDDTELRERLRARFERIMVDELQDTNRVQLELIELLAEQNLFTVGDAQQSIYGFRHADVELFESRGRRLEDVGARATLQTNFRSQPGILEVINRAFEVELGDRFRPLVPGRPAGVSDTQGDGASAAQTASALAAQTATPLVELLVADKGADWESDGLASPWRVAEARALGDRVGDLVTGGAAPKDIVVLLRAATDMRVYERALEERGIPTYVIGGRGYWSHPQVVDMVAYLRALANPRDVESLYTVLASPLVGVSLDGLVVLAAAARSAGRDPWWVISDPEDRLDELSDADRERFAGFAVWFAQERRASARLGVEQLIGRVLELTGYDDAVLALPGGQRRLANVRKLMRLGAEQEAASGDPLRDFLDLVRFRSGGWGASDSSESEAPVEGEGLDAVRLMTIHRAKGLEFDIVCVADLGRGPRGRSELIRIGRDGRFGLRLSQPGTGRSEGALDYKALGDEQVAREGREERRLFYVAMTRARERLVLSGAAKLEAWPTGPGGGPMGWLGPAIFPGLTARAEQREDGVEHGVQVRFFGAEDQSAGGQEAPPAAPSPLPSSALPPSPPLPPPPAPVPAVTQVSYSALEEYRRCGYRFYVERVLGLPPLEQPVVVDERGAVDDRAARGEREATERLGPTDRGILVHALLERLDFKRPVAPDADAIAKASEVPLLSDDAEEIAGLVKTFLSSEVPMRLGRATTVRSEQRFVFLLGGAPGFSQPLLIRGVLDAIAYEPGGLALVVDYKTDRLDGAEPAEVVRSAYLAQRLIYALAALHSGARQVEVVHTFLERPDRPVAARFTQEDVPSLEAELGQMAAGMMEGDFTVTPLPHRGVCRGCPAEGGLCSYPLAETRREAPDRLF